MSHMKKILLGAITMTVCLYGSGGTAQTEGEGPYYVALRAEKACDELKERNEFQNWTQLSECYERNVRSVYTEANYPNPDLVDLLFIKYREIHINIDSNKISVSEGLRQKKRALDEINRIIASREVIRFEA